MVPAQVVRKEIRTEMDSQSQEIMVSNTQTHDMGDQVFIIEGELVRENKEDVLDLPSSPRMAPND